MADITVKTISTEPRTNLEEQEHTTLQLRYPSIDLRTSFESLLTNSTISTRTVMARPSELDESWASLDTSDFSHDEDLQSDGADTGSLIDLSSAHDTESVVEDNEGHEDAEEADDQATSMIVEESMPDQNIAQREEQCDAEDEATEDTIILQRSQEQPTEDSIDLEYYRKLSSSIIPISHPRSLPTQEKISMTISRASLIVASRPFSIAYYGAASANDTKEELLGKIGAALVSDTSRTSIRASQVYNVIPTEFGPGSKPAFADLIPSQAQISVDDVNLLKTDIKHPDAIRFGFKRGIVFESRAGSGIGPHSDPPWQPDLLVVQVSREDVAEDFFTVCEVLELARRHNWPTVIVTRDPTNGLFPMHCYCGITQSQDIKDGNDICWVPQPVDLDTFVALDSEQLNRHLRYLADRSQYCQTRSLREEVKSLVDELCVFFRVPYIGGGMKTQPYRSRKYELHLVGPLFTAVSEEPPVTLYTFMHHFRGMLRARDVLKDIFLSMTIILLGIYVVSFSQVLSPKAGPILTSNTTASSSLTSVVGVVEPVTSSVSVSTAIPSPTHVHSIEHDVIVYDPVSFDQVWQRLTGRPVAEDEPKQEITSEPQQGKESKADLAIQLEDAKVKVREATAKVQESLQNLIKAFSGEPGPMKVKPHRTGRPKTRSRGKKLFERISRQIEFKKAKMERIEEMHKKLSDFWSDVSKNMEDLSEQSQDTFNDLVARSQKHIQRAKWASGKRLEQILHDQKKVLSKAQRQAQLLTPQIPKRKRKSLFARD